MRKLILLIGLLACLVPVGAQAPVSDDALLAKTRNLYDAPFARNLVSFDCAVQFDWKNHIQEALGSVPPAAVPTVDRLQAIPHRVFVNREGAVVSAVPKTPDLSAVPHGSDLEQALSSMVAGGINVWIPFATNVILPIKPTEFSFQRSDDGYKVTLTGNGVDATLLLRPDLRLTDGNAHLPLQVRFTTRFIDGPNGYLLESVTTVAPRSPEGGGEAKFDYRFQTVQGFQLPSEVSVKPSVPGSWHFSLTDCKAMTGTILNVAAPPTIQ